MDEIDDYVEMRVTSDIVVHPDGGIWFTDPSYGINGNYEGYQAEKEVKEAVYRLDSKTAQVVKVTDEVVAPNGICFSPDYKHLYVADTGARETKIWEVDGDRLVRGNCSSSWMYQALALPRVLTASAAMLTATSGEAPGPECRLSRPPANALA